MKLSDPITRECNVVNILITLLGVFLGAKTQNSKYNISVDWKSNWYTEFLLAIRWILTNSLGVAIFKEARPIFSTFFQTFGDFAITRKLIFFSKLMENCAAVS